MDTSSSNKPIVTNQNPNPAVSLINLESLIKNALLKIQNLKEEIKKEKEMFEDGLNNDTVYNQTQQKLIEATNVKNETRKQMLKQPAIITVSQKLKDLREELKELQESLSNALQQYRLSSGQTQIETDSGEVLEIVFTARLVKKRAH